MRLSTWATGLVLCAAPLAAQEPWGASYYPYFLKGPNDQLSVVLHYQYGQPADYFDRVPFAQSLSLEGGINASGSRFLIGHLKFPRLAPGWRLYGAAGAVRENRFGYFGRGNDTEETEDPPAENTWVNRMRRSRYFGRVELTRQLVGPLHLSLGGSITDARFATLPGGSRFLDDHFIQVPCLPGEPCPQPPGDPSDVDVLGQVRLILDVRDNEFVASRGVFVEAGLETGSGGEGYSGAFVFATGSIPPWEGAVLASRVLVRSIESGAPLDARYTLHAWERSIPLLGGPESHRAFVYGRYTGRQVVVGSLEFRQDILNFGDYGAFTGIGFIDAGMVQEVKAAESNTLHVGGGVGLAMRILRSTVLQFTFAVGGDGFQFSMGSGWSF